MSKNGVGIGAIAVAGLGLWALTRKTKAAPIAVAQTGGLPYITGTRLPAPTPQPGGGIDSRLYVALPAPAPAPAPEVARQVTVSPGIAQAQETAALQLAAPATDVAPGSASLLIAITQPWAPNADVDPYLHPTADTIAQVRAMYLTNPNAVIMSYSMGPGMGLQPNYALTWLRANDPSYQMLPPPPPWPSWAAILAYEAAVAAGGE